MTRIQKKTPCPSKSTRVERRRSANRVRLFLILLFVASWTITDPRVSDLLTSFQPPSYESDYGSRKDNRHIVLKQEYHNAHFGLLKESLLSEDLVSKASSVYAGDIELTPWKRGDRGLLHRTIQYTLTRGKRDRFPFLDFSRAASRGTMTQTVVVDGPTSLVVRTTLTSPPSTMQLRLVQTNPRSVLFVATANVHEVDKMSLLFAPQVQWGTAQALQEFLVRVGEFLERGADWDKLL